MARDVYKLTLTNMTTGKEAVIKLAVVEKRGQNTFLASDFTGLSDVVDDEMKQPACIFLEDAAMEAAQVLGVDHVAEEEEEDEEEDDLDDEDDDNLDDEEE